MAQAVDSDFKFNRHGVTLLVVAIASEHGQVCHGLCDKSYKLKYQYPVLRYPVPVPEYYY
eukprot:206303-Rhodomonas_salina.1